MKFIIMVVVLGCIVSCDSNDINDSHKRNAHWAWWVDAKTGKGKWIPVTNQTTVKNGSYTLFYYNGNVFEKGKVKDGKHVDTAFEYDYQGKLYANYFWKNDSTYFLNDGPVQNFRSDGMKASEGIVTNHKDGDKWIAYYENGNKEWERDFTKGDTGWQVHYFENGQKKDSAIYLNDLSWGTDVFIVKRWYENGTIARIEHWKNKMANGAAISYYENGQMKDSVFAINGKLEGSGKEWYENGDLKRIFQIKVSKLNGLTKQYYETGKIKEVDFYKNDKIINGTIYDERGNILNTMKNSVIQH